MIIIEFIITKYRYKVLLQHRLLCEHFPCFITFKINVIQIYTCLFDIHGATLHLVILFHDY